MSKYSSKVQISELISKFRNP